MEPLGRSRSATVRTTSLAVVGVLALLGQVGETSGTLQTAQATAPAAPGSLTAPPEVLTNELVIKLVQSGLSEGVIVEKIRSTPSGFNVDTGNLIALKNAGVPDRVIEAMVAKGRQVLPPAPGPEAPLVVAPIPQPGFPTPVPFGPGALPFFSARPVEVRDTVIYIREGKPIELEYVRGRVTSSGYMVYTSSMILNEARAQLRIAEERPTFFVGTNPTELILVRLYSHLKRNNRSLRVGRVQNWGYFHEVKQHIDTAAMVPIDYEKLPSGYYRVSPKGPLPTAEYGFLRDGVGRVYDFGRD